MTGNTDNMDIYNRAKEVPKEARKEIGAGRLKGFTDINPMWRIKRLTELFGPCGLGWWYEIKNKWLESANGEIKAFVDIDLFYTYGGVNSKAIPGTGGSAFVAIEKNGPYVSDECYKMALTDAISVAAKSIGIGADVYYEKDRDKYTAPAETAQKAPQSNTQKAPANNTTAQKEPAQAACKPQNPAPANGQELPPPNEDGYYYCDKCKKVVSRVMGNGGAFLPPKEVVRISYKRTGHTLCADCLKGWVELT